MRWVNRVPMCSSRRCASAARCGVIFPELAALYGVPQPPRWHPEVDTGVHVMLALRYSADSGASTTVRFAVLMHDLGKALTSPARWPSHHGHEEAGVPVIERLCARLKVPNGFRDLAVLTARHHAVVHRAAELRPATVLKLFEATDAFRRPERFEEMLAACEADARGRTGLEAQPYPQRDYLRQARAAAAAVTLDDSDRQGLVGAAIGERIREKRVAAIKSLTPRD